MMEKKKVKSRVSGVPLGPGYKEYPEKNKRSDTRSSVYK